MVKKIINYLKDYVNKYINLVKNKKYKRQLSSEKSKLYMNSSVPKSKYKSSRNKFKIFKTKLEFENTFNDVKNITTYYYLVGFFLFICTFYILIFSHYFYIKTIDIIRQDETINLDLSYKSIDKFRYKSIFLVNSSEIKDNILLHQPNIESAEVRKIFPGNIKITLKSYDVNNTFDLNGKTYSISDNGVVIPSKPNEELHKLEIKGIENNGFFEYKKIFKQEHILKINEILNLCKTNTTFLNISKIIYYKKEAELHIVDNNGILIIFDLTKDANTQIDKLNIFHTKYINKIKAGIIYIDLRINEKIIYCDRTEEFQCKQNLKSIY